MSDAPQPYLSVVVTTRNDDHGGDPLQRFQAFLDSLVAQCNRNRLDAELIVVEWNPDPSRPRLVQAMRWPDDPGHCRLKIIEVPNELHRRLKGSESLPLFQMIGKNVGIRRARGEFILCTNIDIIFSHELFEFLAARRLERGRAYRVVRYDVAPGFPRDVDVDTLLGYCRSHQIRGHFANGSFPTESDGSLALFDNDIVDPRAGIRLGRGWHMREGAHVGSPFRWIADRAELIFLEVADTARPLELGVEPNRYEPGIPVRVSASDQDGTVLERWSVSEPSSVTLTVPPGAAGRRVWLNLENGADLDKVQRPVFENRDQLRYVATHLRWHVETDRTPVAKASRGDPPITVAPMTGWRRAAEHVPSFELRTDGLHLLTLAPENAYSLYYGPFRAAQDGVHRFQLRYAMVEGEILLGPLSHDELWWRDHEVERSRTKDEAIIDMSVPLKAGDEVTLVVYNHHPLGDIASSVILRELTFSAGVAPAPASAGSRRRRGLIGRALNRLPSGAKQRLKRFLSRSLLPVVEWQVGTSLADQVYERLQEERRLWQKSTRALAESNQELHARVLQLAPLTEVAQLYAFLRRVHPESVSANACGDFLLMAREHWFELRAYAEFEMYSMNIDGLFTYTAHYGGAPEQRLEPAMCIYHMEHAVGSGWTPEGESQLRDRMQQWGVDWLDWQTVALWVTYMHSLRRPMVFNGENWGFADITLPEIAPSPQPAK